MSSVEEKKHKLGCNFDNRFYPECTCDKPDKDSINDALGAICDGLCVASNEGLWADEWTWSSSGLWIKIKHKDSGKKYRLTIEEIK